MQIQKVDSTGTPITNIATLQNTDWIDLAADQTTLLYSNEGNTIREINTQPMSTRCSQRPYAALFAALSGRWRRDRRVERRKRLTVGI